MKSEVTVQDLRAAILTAAALLAATGTVAQEPESVELDIIEVRALPQGGSALDATHPVDVLTGESLDDRKEATLGETLQAEPGIHSTYFGPGAGRPVIRGLGGSRVRVAEDGLNAADASALSPDHAVSAEPLLVDQIEILRGPATLLYGSTASGGVVNLIDNRIPEQRQDFSARFELRGNSVADERAGVVRIDGGVGVLQFHIDGFKRETNDYEIPGFALSADELAELDDEERAEQVRGRLENSAQQADGGTLGFSIVGDWGFAGLSHKRFNTRYGIPGGHAHEEDHGDGDPDDEHGEAAVSIDLEQKRNDFRLGLEQPIPGIESARLKLADSDYRHVEFEGDQPGTTFDVEGLEARLEARHAAIGRLDGVFGLQYENTELGAFGEEAFVPPATTESLGLFLIEELDLDPLSLSAGLRWQNDEIGLDDGAQRDGVTARDFDLLSLSAGAVWRFAPQWQASLNWQRSERAPTQEELFALGPHAATQAFEIGDSGLRRERSNNWDFGIHKYLGAIHLRADVYYNEIDDFVYLAYTPDEEDGLPVQRWSQADARFRGLEVEASRRWDIGAAGEVELRLFGDTVQAELDAGNGEVPRLSPTRLGAGLDWHRGPWRANLNYYRVLDADEPAEFETATDGYDMLGANLVRLFYLGSNELEVFLKGSNLLDQTQRVHTSFLKEQAPLPGLSISAGLRVRLQ